MANKDVERAAKKLKTIKATRAAKEKLQSGSPISPDERTLLQRDRDVEVRQRREAISERQATKQAELELPLPKIEKIFGIFPGLEPTTTDINEVLNKRQVRMDMLRGEKLQELSQKTPPTIEEWFVANPDKLAKNQ